MYSCSTKELRRTQTTRDWNQLSVTWLTAPKPQSFSDLLRPDKRKEEEKLDSRLHTRTPCAWRANTDERLSRLWLDLSPQKHSVTHTLAPAHVDRANTVCVTHTAAGAKTGSRRPLRLSRYRIIHGSCLKTGRSGTKPSLFHHFPPPYPAAISVAADANAFFFLCAKIQAVCTDEILPAW